MTLWAYLNLKITNMLRLSFALDSPANSQSLRMRAKKKPSIPWSVKSKRAQGKYKWNSMLRLGHTYKKWKSLFHKLKNCIKVWLGKERLCKIYSFSKWMLCTRWEIYVLSCMRNQEKFWIGSPRPKDWRPSTIHSYLLTTWWLSGETWLEDSSRSLKKTLILSLSTSETIFTAISKYSASKKPSRRNLVRQKWILTRRKRKSINYLTHQNGTLQKKWLPPSPKKSFTIKLRPLR